LCCEFVGDDIDADAASDWCHPRNVGRYLFDGIDLNVDRECADGCGFCGLLFLGPPSDLFIVIGVFVLRSKFADSHDAASNLPA
jgi:hypothetical protein